MLQIVRKAVQDYDSYSVCIIIWYIMITICLWAYSELSEYSWLQYDMIMITIQYGGCI